MAILALRWRRDRGRRRRSATGCRTSPRPSRRSWPRA